MDKTALVESDIADGARAVHALEAAGLPIAVAAWLKLKNSSIWQLHIASPDVQLYGPIAAYKFADEILQAIESPVAVDLVVLSNTTNNFLNAIPKRFTKHIKNQGKLIQDMIRAADFDLQGTEIDGAVIYRIHPGVKPSKAPLKSNREAVQRARALAA